jgi:MFS family permease
MKLRLRQFASGAALISDGYFNNTMTMVNIVLKKEYPKQYTSSMSTQVSNALLVGEIFGQVTVGLTCDYLGRKFAIILTTLMIGMVNDYISHWHPLMVL